MLRRSLISAALASSLAIGSLSPAFAQTEIQWWHSMGGNLGEWVNDQAKGFNESQKEYRVVPVFKGSYDESMTAAIAAYRAGNAPHILQVFEVGTATMMASKGAIKPVHELMKEAGYKFDPAVYVPAVAGYYTAPNGQMLSLPFNSSTTVFHYNKDAFKAAGLDPDKPPQTWPEVVLAAAKLKASGHKCPFTTSWISWTQLESFSAWHNTEFATLRNGFGGMGTRLAFNTPLHVRHVENLANMAKQGLFVYKGRGNTADSVFVSGECAMITGSSAMYGNIKKNAKFAAGHSTLPYYPDVTGRTAKHGDRRRELVGDVRQKTGRVQRRGRVLRLSIETGRAIGEPSAHRVSADHDSRLRADRQRRLLQAEPGYRCRRDADDSQDHR